MESLARAAHEKGGFTGVWLYAEKGEIISKGAIGMTGQTGNEPVRENMVFDLASVSKQFTATAIMLLRRKGLLSLEDEITKFFPELPIRASRYAICSITPAACPTIWTGSKRPRSGKTRSRATIL